MLRPAVRPPRLLLVGKAAVAAAIAWAVGALLPWGAAEYAYYAPLGAVIAMAPTVVSSVRSSAQLVVGLASGIAIAWLLVPLALPEPLKIALAVGAGTLVAGIPVLGSGRDYVPVAALFTLLLGGSELGDYSFGYVAQMATGLVVGVAVNLLVAPPLQLQDARESVSRLKRRAADHLDGAASVLTEPKPGDDELSRSIDDYPALLEDAFAALDTARESRRINPRARRWSFDVDGTRDDLDALRRVGRHLQDLDAALLDGPHEAVPADLREAMGDAVRATAELLRAWDRGDDLARHCGDSLEAHRALRRRAGGWDAPTPESREQVAVTAFSLRTVHDEVEHRVRSSDRPAP